MTGIKESSEGLKEKALIYTRGNLTVAGTATLTNDNGYVIRQKGTDGSTVIIDGEISCTGNTVNRVIEIENGSFVVKGKDTKLTVTNKNGYAIRGEEGVSFTRGTVKLTGGGGVSSGGKISITSGDLEVQATNAVGKAIVASGTDAADIEIGTGMEIIKPDQGIIVSTGSGSSKNVVAADRFGETAKYVHVGREVSKYDIWVGDVRITAANRDDIPNLEGSGAHGSYDPSSNTL